MQSTCLTMSCLLLSVWRLLVQWWNRYVSAPNWMSSYICVAVGLHPALLFGVLFNSSGCSPRFLWFLYNPIVSFANAIDRASQTINLILTYHDWKPKTTMLPLAYFNLSCETTRTTERRSWKIVESLELAVMSIWITQPTIEQNGKREEKIL